MLTYTQAMCWITYDEVNASGVSNTEGALVLNMWALKKQRVGRDSARAAVALVPPDLCGCRPSDWLACCTIHGCSQAVSYTHLTLPTIYSV